MIQSSATTRNQNQAILSSSFYSSDENGPHGLVRLLSQGVTVGAFVGFMAPVLGMLSNPENGYNFLYSMYLPLFLLVGMEFGLFEGLIFWACAYIVGHRLNAIIRAGLGIVLLAMLLVAYDFLFVEPAPYGERASEPVSVRTVNLYIVYGMLFGLVIGSRLEPIGELVKGTTDSQWRVLSAITGFALRVFVLFALMESVLYLIWTVQGDWLEAEFTFAAIAFIHFIAAAVIVFARLPFPLLVTFASITNFPIVVFVLNELDAEQSAFGYLSIVYLALWVAFLLTRLPNATLFFIKKELRYYLID